MPGKPVIKPLIFADLTDTDRSEASEAVNLIKKGGGGWMVNSKKELVQIDQDKGDVLRKMATSHPQLLH